jgi:L-lactate dehydrogenase complex protein LldF
MIMRSEYKKFCYHIQQKSADDRHRLKILKAVTTHENKVAEMQQTQFGDWQFSTHKAALIKQYVLDHLPELLETFERRISGQGGKVLWASDASEARSIILKLANEHQARKIVKSKSMTTEEIDLNDHLEAHGITVVESDLGELIVQLAGEKPYHIVTPAMHKTKEEISELFQRTLNAPPTSSAEELTMIARAHLRETYITADIGITGANFLIAEEGAIVMTENEGNGRLSMSCPRVHIAVAGIEKILPKLEHLALFLPLLATAGTGQQITCYNSIVRGAKRDDEVDGPQHMYVVLLDNGRSTIYGNTKLRESLRCIRCCLCLNACPVYRIIGGHSYGTTYQGPIGIVLTPQLRGMHAWQHMAYASSLCGACTDNCPVEIELHRLILENRHLAYQAKFSGRFMRTALKIWAWIMSDRRRLNRMRYLFTPFIPLGKLFLPKSKRKRIPKPAKRTFSDLWDDNGK